MAAAGVKTQIGRESRAQYGEKHAGVIYTKERHKEPGQRGFPKDADEGTSEHPLQQPRHRRDRRRPAKRRGRRLGDGLQLPPHPHPRSGEPNHGGEARELRPRHRQGGERRRFRAESAEQQGRVERRSPHRPAERISRRRLGHARGAFPATTSTPCSCACGGCKTIPTRRSERKQFAGYGLAADEFPDNDHAPYEIYVREARRLVGRYVFKEQDNVIAEGIARTPIHADSIAITDWPVDSVACLPRKVPGGNRTASSSSAKNRAPRRCPIAACCQRKSTTCSCPSRSPRLARRLGRDPSRTRLDADRRKRRFRRRAGGEGPDDTCRARSRHA